jgi:hypothetical protein
MMLLVPADVLRPRRADEHFAPEAVAARTAGLEVALVDRPMPPVPAGRHCRHQAKAPMPVMSRPTIRAWIVSVPSKVWIASRSARCLLT